MNLLSKIFLKSSLISSLFLMPVKESGTKRLESLKSGYGQIVYHKKTILLNPAHGMSTLFPGKIDGGAEYETKDSIYLEANMNLYYAKKVREMLDPAKFEVYLIRENNKTSHPRNSLMKSANKLDADAYIGIHVNNNNSNITMKGFEILYRQDKSKQFAETASKVFAKWIPTGKNRFAKRRWKELKGQKIDNAIIVEGGYLSNSEDRLHLLFLEEPPYINAVVETIEEFFKNKIEISHIDFSKNLSRTSSQQSS